MFKHTNSKDGGNVKVRLSARELSKVGDEIIRGCRLMPEICRSLARGTKKSIRPMIIYAKCPACDGLVEIWSDEDIGFCLGCGTGWQRPKNLV